MELSVVIPARNEEANLPRQLHALLEQSWSQRWEIVVVDNGSTDRTAAVVTELALSHPRLRLVVERTPGLCHARNTGIAAAAASSVAVCDADDMVAPGWVAAMGDALTYHELVCGRYELDQLNPSWLANSRGRSTETAVPTFHGLFPFPAGNNFGLKRDVIDRIEGFDQNYIGAEDVEFGLRAWRAGIELRYEPAAVVHYSYRSTAGELWRQGLTYGRRRPAIARDLVDANLPRPPAVAGWRSWAWLLVNAPRVVTPNGRALLAWVAGNRIGHLSGSIRYRTVLL